MPSKRNPLRHDEDHEAFDRPRRRTQPRTKVRPSYDDAVIARVVTIDRGRYTVRLDDGTDITAVKARSIGRKGLVVGDRARESSATSVATKAPSPVSWKSKTALRCCAALQTTTTRSNASSWPTPTS